MKRFQKSQMIAAMSRAKKSASVVVAVIKSIVLLLLEY